MLYSLVLETPTEWPGWTESATRTEMRAAAADLRHLQGFLGAVGREQDVSSLGPEDAYLSTIAGKRPASWEGGGMDRARARGRSPVSGSKRHYRPGATKRLTVQATPVQEIAWTDAGRKMNMPLGPFLSFAWGRRRRRP